MTIFRPTDEQKNVIEGSSSALIIAGPGKGKTSTAIASAKYWVERNIDGKGNVLFTSFSNAAVLRIANAGEIDLSGIKKKCQFRTFHSLSLEILRNYGRFIGLKHVARALDKTEEHLEAVERGWSPGDSSTYSQNLRRLAMDSGKVAFEHMIPLAVKLLEGSPTIKASVGMQYPLIIVDEFQDTRPDQWRLLKAIGGRSRILAFGDPNQMIYERQHQAALDRLADFERWKQVNRIVFTGNNFRCDVHPIINFAESLLKGTPYEEADSDGIDFFESYPNQRRSILASIWAEIRRQAGHDSTIAFIVPSARTARQTAAELRSPEPNVVIPLAVHAHVESDEVELETFRLLVYATADYVEDKSDGFRKTLSNALAVFVCAWTRKELTTSLVDRIHRRLSPCSRARSAFREFLNTSESNQIGDFGRLADHIVNVLIQDPEFETAGRALLMHGIPRILNLSPDTKSFYAEYRKSRATVGLEGMIPTKAKTSITSMYRSKGREFDFVVLVVEPRDHSQNSTIDELRRLYYVSATRAKEWLGVLYTPRRLGPVLGAALPNK